MARGISLHIGLNRVDPAHYDGWDGALTACEFDAHDMKAIAESCRLRDQHADDGGGDGRRGDDGDRARPPTSWPQGDLFFCSYSGHGGQVPDRNGEDEEDRSDETWVAYDRQIVDDELYALWGKFAPGVRIFVLSDSCHSGIGDQETSTADVPDPVSTREKAAAESPRYRAMPRDVMIATYNAHAQMYDDIQQHVPGSEQANPDATVLLISGCRTTSCRSTVSATGCSPRTCARSGTTGPGTAAMPEFRETIRARMPANQQPNYMRGGRCQSRVRAAEAVHDRVTR